MTLRRFSSRTEPLDTEFLAKSLEGATKYLRIAGYFRSSIFELVGEQIAKIPEVKILCNSELDFADFKVAACRATALKERWNQVDIGLDALLQKDRYQKLDALLKAGNVEIRVVPKERLFLHGKAGSITYADGRRVSFMGSVNETKSAMAHNYELVWQDDDIASADWVEKEFWALWKDGVPLPETILAEITRVANRREVSVEVLKPQDLPGAVMAEAPIYRGGEQLQPWQRSFVTLFLKHRETYGKVRLLLADEVGVGKTLSLATSALVALLLNDGPVLILAPSTLTFQWQVELMDRLGIPSAVWSSLKKVWLGVEGQQLSPKGYAESIKNCPHQIGIVSTGLIFHTSKEADYLAGMRFGTVVLDEAHKARVKGGLGEMATDPNNLLSFMRKIGIRTRHLLLGTATPIQTKVRELWDLLEIINSGAEFVLGDSLSLWRDWEPALSWVTGATNADTSEEVWQWLSNPFPPLGENGSIDTIRDALGLDPKTFGCSHRFEDLDYMTKEIYLPQCLGPGFFEDNNPIVRHVVLRRRSQLEKDGLLEKIGVDTHPLPGKEQLYNSRFVDLGLLTNTPFEVAYRATERFSELMQKRTKSAGFMKSLMLQRVCSSFASGLATAKRLLAKNEFDDEEDLDAIQEQTQSMTSDEISCLREIVCELERPEARDPKLETVQWFLTEFHTDGKTWLEHGCIIFSQYYDTSFWVAKELANRFPSEVVAVYAGVEKSGLFRGGQFSSVERDAIKKAVKTREIRLIVATDAACEGLNLQTLGTLINVDLPWNPSRLEQRLGRIKRIGQARRTVDMLNLVYHETRDEKVYKALSERLKATYDIFGSLPDTIEDEWIESEELMKQHLDAYIHERKLAENAFTIRYKNTLDPSNDRWERCAEVLSRRDILQRVSKGW
jgi:superfamily II DNA or RNA helicase